MLNGTHSFCDGAIFDAFHRNHGDNGWAGFHRIPSVLWASWPSVAASVLSKSYEVLEDMLQVDCLFLDDIGAENDAFKIASDRLCQVLSKRERKFTMITTNISPEDWGEKFDVRIEDRLLRNSVIVDMTEVPSYSIYKLTKN